jgi:hypothetical protein
MLRQDDIRPFKLACRQAAATLFAGLAAGGQVPYAVPDASAKCLKTVTQIAARKSNHRPLKG